MFAGHYNEVYIFLRLLIRFARLSIYVADFKMGFKAHYKNLTSQTKLSVSSSFVIKDKTTCWWKK